MKQFETLRFTANRQGQERKNASLAYLTTRGWQIRNEIIEQGKFKGDDACCLALLCLPLSLAAGHNPDVTVVNIERDAPEQGSIPPHEASWVPFDDNPVPSGAFSGGDRPRVICEICGKVARKGWQLNEAHP